MSSTSKTPEWRSLSALTVACMMMESSSSRAKENSVSKLCRGGIQYSRDVENFVMLAGIQKRKYQII